MSDPRSMPARYDPDRLPNGHFAKGNRVSDGNADKMHKNLLKVRNMWHSLITIEEMQEMKERLLEICRVADPETSLKALVYYFDRSLGKPEATINVETDGTNPFVNINVLSIEEQEFAAKLVGKLSGRDAEVVSPVALPAQSSSTDNLP